MIKIGVDLRGIHPQIAVAYCIASAIYRDKAGIPCVITSASDGKHGTNSLHYKGLALDLRTSTLKPEQVQPVYLALQSALGPQFDVVLEDEGGPNQHIHCEFDVKEQEKAADV